MRAFAAVCGLVMGALALVETSLSAQVGSATITGVVRDQAGAAVPAAAVTVTSVDTNRPRVVTTSSEGVYTAPGLAPGGCRVDVELSGFKPVRREDIRIATGQTMRLDFELSVGDVREQVRVKGETPLLRAESASLGAVIENDQVVQLPLNGRTFI